MATIALYPVDDPSAYGLVRRTPEGEITDFLEKPDPAEIDTDEINAGAYFLERSVLDLVPPGRQRLDRAGGLPAPRRPGAVRSPP